MYHTSLQSDGCLWLFVPAPTPQVMLLFMQGGWCCCRILELVCMGYPSFSLWHFVLYQSQNLTVVRWVGSPTKWRIRSHPAGWLEWPPSLVGLFFAVLPTVIGFATLVRYVALLWEPWYWMLKHWHTRDVILMSVPNTWKEQKMNLLEELLCACIFEQELCVLKSFSEKEV